MAQVQAREEAVNKEHKSIESTFNLLVSKKEKKSELTHLFDTVKTNIENRKNTWAFIYRN